ncbi:ABC transporter substrate-binding protein [Denitromonas sp.]|uniref:ABC transporter substrate-binding protein n=1 Tax=Denitromonas sp. TaxID=2734609 RepID=UPI003A8C85A9
MFLRSRLLRLATIAAVHRFAGWQWVRLAWQSAARVVTGGLLAALLAACGSAWNDPYPAAEAGKNILYSAFTNRPKHLDPVQSYAEDEATFLYQIYEPPLQYHYLKRPYSLIPGSAAQMPVLTRYDKDGVRLADDAPVEQVAYTVYDIRIREGVMYQPHPAFAMDDDGKPVYVPMPPGLLENVMAIPDFRQTGTRELVAADFVYQLKRLAHPRLHSPIFELMSGYIPGLRPLQAALDAAVKAAAPDAWIDLDAFALEGVEVVDRYTYRIRVKGTYPQLSYWMTMPFFAPVPREVDRFYAQPGMAEKNLTLDWWPVGTGPYMLVENDPNARMVLARNPNFRGETYPCDADDADVAAGMIADCGKPIPFIDRAVFSREKESIPYWNKFLQGYYDASGLSSDNFDQAVQMGGEGEVGLSDEMRARGIDLITSVSPTVMYLGFNMLDPLVGGSSEAARKLRLALSIAIDQEEFIAVFLNGRGSAAMHPVPPGIFGHEPGEAGINPMVYNWVDGAPARKSAEVARQLLAEAGYPGGRDARSGEPLVIHLDTTSSGLGQKSYVDWLTKQLKKIDVQLVVRGTDWNRLQDKLRKGNAQMFFMGWNADYPDPENFYFLLYGPQGRVATQGENAANYLNAEFDRLFEAMKVMPNGPERLEIIRKMNRILQHDAPWIWGFHQKAFVLQHGWLKNRKPGAIVRNTLKYQRIDADLRSAQRAAWNRPVLWPLGLIGGLLVLMIWPMVRRYRAHERQTMRAADAAGS